ncbi:DeoR/GlpR family DNA-binding transcription regulator [Acetobacter sp. DsW_063]|uniref:DeoR/GlpR family DNA-binding transcription regulator n=1 Tax=Acetobacter sp. DsW_063 TaxID=1514894 RepID=UPI000A361E0F|nr:DeoR/GlpR family DNA-binding transcription regulator [Acetobacter sp. DsW_063]OUJ14461.1 DeoR family transcriptional regulator [Acetobacter sp. DsW_063]
MARSVDTGGVSGAVAARRQALLQYVTANGNAQIEELAEHFATSRMTVHRDVQALAAEGLLRKVHGGVTTLSTGSVETSILHRSRRATHEKRAIANVASRLVSAGDIVVLDDSSTAAILSDYLVQKAPLIVITNSLGTGARLSSARGIELISLGGQYRPTFDAFFGNLCELSVSALRANTLFMSVSAIHGAAAYHQEQEVIKAKLAMMGIVDRRVLLVDSMKFDVSALNRLADLTAFDIVITDAGIAPDTRSRLEDAGVNLQIASLRPERGANQAEVMQVAEE